MLKAAAFFAIVALVMGVLGFGGIAGFAWGLAKLLFWVAVIIALLFLVLGYTVFRRVSR